MDLFAWVLNTPLNKQIKYLKKSIGARNITTILNVSEEGLLNNQFKYLRKQKVAAMLQLCQVLAFKNIANVYKYSNCLK